MGTTCAPMYANLFLGWWENCHVFTEDMTRFTSHIIFWGRYIDNILLLWDGELTLFKEFVVTPNDNTIVMHLTSEIHKTAGGFSQTHSNQ